MNKYKTIDEFLGDLSGPRKAEVATLRKIILETNPALKEHVKWNAPSYYLKQDDCITFNMHDQHHVRLVLHAGATRKEDKTAQPVLEDETGLLQWNSDIRATMTFGDVADIESKRENLAVILNKWLEIFG